jgi:hypothetical protein
MSWIEEAEIGIFFIPFVTLFYFYLYGLYIKFHIDQFRETNQTEKLGKWRNLQLHFLFWSLSFSKTNPHGKHQIW